MTHVPGRSLSGWEGIIMQHESVGTLLCGQEPRCVCVGPSCGIFLVYEATNTALARVDKAAGT